MHEVPILAIWLFQFYVFTNCENVLLFLEESNRATRSQNGDVNFEAPEATTETAFPLADFDDTFIVDVAVTGELCFGFWVKYMPGSVLVA